MGINEIAEFLDYHEKYGYKLSFRESAKKYTENNISMPLLEKQEENGILALYDSYKRHCQEHYERRLEKYRNLSFIQRLFVTKPKLK